MPEYIDKEKLIRDLIDNRSFYPAIVKKAIEDAPTADVVPRSTIKEMFEELKKAGIDKYRYPIIAELKKKYIGE